MIVKTDQNSIKSYLEDASGLIGAHTDKVMIPGSYEEVSEILKEANSNKTAITISGGGTGVTGGRLAFEGQLLAMDRLNKIIELKKGSIVVQGGVPITEIHNAAASMGYIYPPDATEWTAFIGGNIATNASGARTFKYGPTRKYVKRIKVVLANGEVLDINRGEKILNPKSETLNKFKIPNYKMPNIKNAAGYYAKEGMDLIDLFIGSEGTLGVVVESELELLPKRGFTFASFAFFDKLADSLDFVEEVKKITFENRKRKDPSNLDALAIEFFDKDALRMLHSKFPQLPTQPEAVVFFEEEITPERESKYLEDWTELLEKRNISSADVWVADEPKKEAEFKEIRHGIPEAVNEIVRQRGLPKAGTDIAVPHDKFREMFDVYRKSLDEVQVDSLIFGHIGDSHLHVNMLPKTQEELAMIKSIYMDFVRKAVSFGGTCSAEHGIGKIKHHFLREMYGNKGILEMVRVKQTLDPNGILGRDNIFSKSLLGTG